MKFAFLIFFIFSTFVVNAALPEYEAPQILARANISDGYNLPPLSFLSNTNPVINNNGDVSFRVMALEGQNDQAIWVKSSEEDFGEIVYVAPEQRFITDPSINDSGKIVFNLHDEGVTEGLFVLDSKAMQVDQVLSPDDLPIKYYTYPQIKNNGHIFFRATNDENDRSFYEFARGKLNQIISEGIDGQAIKSSYLFKPAVNDAGYIAFKSRLGEKGQWDESAPDQILILAPGNESKNVVSKLITIAKDQDSDSKSPYLRFGNSVSISKQGAVAFMAFLSDMKKTIVVSKDNVLTTIATEGSDDILEIELFTPTINNLGNVVFRAIDSSGKRGIFVANGKEVKKIISEGDEVLTDLGSGRILSNPNYPGFGGDVDMNDEGEIVFNCVVVDEENKELGSAVYMINPKKE